MKELFPFVGLGMPGVCETGACWSSLRLLETLKPRSQAQIGPLRFLENPSGGCLCLVVPTHEKKTRKTSLEIM